MEGPCEGRGPAKRERGASPARRSVLRPRRHPRPISRCHGGAVRGPRSREAGTRHEPGPPFRVTPSPSPPGYLSLPWRGRARAAIPRSGNEARARPAVPRYALTLPPGLSLAAMEGPCEGPDPAKRERGASPARRSASDHRPRPGLTSRTPPPQHARGLSPSCLPHHRPCAPRSPGRTRHPSFCLLTAIERPAYARGTNTTASPTFTCFSITMWTSSAERASLTSSLSFFIDSTVC